MDSRFTFSKFFFLLLAMIFYAGSLYALDPNRLITQYSRDQWTNEQGLPHNNIFDIIQTADGYLWIATEEGVTRFDGSTFTVFPKQHPLGALKSARVLLEDHKGQLWIGTNDGLFCWKDKEMIKYSVKEGLVNNFINALHEDLFHQLWIGTDNGLSVMSPKGAITSYTIREGLAGNNISCFLEDSKGDFWIGTNDGLNKTKRQNLADRHAVKFETFRTTDGLTVNYVRCLYEDTDRNLWIGSVQGINVRDTTGKITKYNSKNGLSHNVVKCIIGDPDGNIWIGTHQGINRWSRGKFTALTEDNGLTNNFIVTGFIDSGGNLWFGSVKGLVRLRNSKFITYSTIEGFANDYLICITEDGEGHLWFGSFGTGLTRLNHKTGEVKIFKEKDGLKNTFVFSLCADKTGSMWVGTNGEGLFRYAGGRFISYAKDIMGIVVMAIYKAKDGSVWFGTESALNQYQDGKFVHYTVNDGIKGRFLASICEDRHGNIYAGTYTGGINKISRGKVTYISTREGLSKDYVTSLYCDSDNVIWIGTNGGGLNRYDGDTCVSFTEKDGLSHDVVMRVLEDDHRQLWISCGRGVMKIPKQQISDFMDKKTDRLKPHLYGHSDGMRTAELVGGSQPSGWKARDGRLWFPTTKGAVTIHPDHDQTVPALFPLYVEKIVTPDSTFTPVQSVILPAGSGQFQIHYTALGFLAEGEIKYRYQLTGLDEQWISADNRRVAYYTNVSPGDYVFRVQAFLNDDPANAVETEFSFRVEPYFYQTTWFYIIGVICFLMIVFGIFRLRVRHLEKRKRELETQVTQKTKQIEQQKNELADALSELKETQTRLIQEAKISSLGQLVAGMAHEINNPLSFIFSYLPIMQDDLSELKRIVTEYESALIKSGNPQLIPDVIVQERTKTLFHDLNSIVNTNRNGVDRIKNIIIELQNFSKINQAELQTADLNRNLTGAVTLFRPSHAHSLDLHVSLGELPPTMCYIKQLNQVFMDLLINAGESIHEKIRRGLTDRGNIWITTSARTKGRPDADTIILSFRDDGLGISPENHSKIFDPFYTTKPVGEGLGMGLAISYRVIQRHNGSMTFYSNGESGTEFIIEIPVISGEQEKLIVSQGL